MIHHWTPQGTRVAPLMPTP